LVLIGHVPAGTLRLAMKKPSILTLPVLLLPPLAAK
jgi:hypothetical protein